MLPFCGKKVFLAFFLGFCLLFSMCSEDDSLDKPLPASPSPIADLLEMYEVFDDVGNGIYLKGRYNTYEGDDADEHGFVFADGNATAESLDISRHTVVRFDIDKPAAVNGYTTVEFDTVLYGVRSPEASERFQVRSYVRTKDTISYSVDMGITNTRKMKILSVSPQSANVGEEIKIEVNREIYSTTEVIAVDGFGTVDNPGKPQPYQLLVGDQPVNISRVSGNALYFLLPAIEDKAKLEIKVNGYRIPSDDYYLSSLNTTYRWEEVTTLKRETNGDHLLFAISEAIYLGGGMINSNEAQQDFWKYDLTTNVWSQAANFPVDGDGDGMSFSTLGKGYGGHPNNLHQYDPSTDEWSKVKRPTTTLQYDHTFGSATPIEYNSQVYFTNYEPEVEIGVYYHNFHQFDPINESYAVQPAFPGDDMPFTYTHGGASYKDKLHFFPKPEHWAYEPESRKWEQLADIPATDKYARAFEYNGTLHLLVREKIGMHEYGPVTLFLYNEQTDSWEADVKLSRNLTASSNFNVLISDQGSIYVCISNRDEIYIEKLTTR